MKASVLFIENVEAALPVSYGKAERVATDLFTHVADVECGDSPHPQDVAWEIVQNVDSRWMDDPRVSLTPDGRAIYLRNHLRAKKRNPETKLAESCIRSMMVGDVVRVGSDLFICVSYGWTKLRPDGDHYAVEC
ncbi:MAG: hypothetical protein WC072_05400 [Methanoregulaceae archaeon]|jgi:hypothetical protein